MSNPDFFDDLGRHLDRAAHRQARYGRLAAAPIPSATAVLAAVLVALVVGAGAYALPRLAGTDDEAASPPTPRGPEAITVTPDVIRLGEGLVGVNIARSDGRLYVLAGRSRAEQDLVFITETAVLAAFDDGGTELWRTELDRLPTEVQVVDGDPWVTLDRASSPGPLQVVKVDAEDGDVVGEIGIPLPNGISDQVGRVHFFEAFGALWVTRREPTVEDNTRPAQMVRAEVQYAHEISRQTHLNVPFYEGDCRRDEPDDDAGWCPGEARAGAGAIWVPLKTNGVAMIDPDTNDVTVIGADEIGHEVLEVAFDDDVAYVSSFDRVTSIVDGEVVATTSPGEIANSAERSTSMGGRYLGPVDGAFGIVHPATRRLHVLRANEPMVAESRRLSLEGHPGGIFEVDGDAWESFGRNQSFRRISILP